jgi:antitoxin ParD1/3/4
MTSLNVSLPEPMKAFIEEEVRRGRFSTPSEFVRALVREKQEARMREALEQQLLEGLRSGKPTAMTARDWGAIRERVLGGAKSTGKRQGERKRKKASSGRR